MHTRLPLQNSDAREPASEPAVQGGGGRSEVTGATEAATARERSGARGPHSGPRASEEKGGAPQTWTRSSGGCPCLLTDQDCLNAPSSGVWLAFYSVAVDFFGGGAGKWDFFFLKTNVL